MRKILSLLALLVTTVTAMAIDFTDHRSVNESGQNKLEVDDAQLTVTPNGDNTYNVTFHDVQALYYSSKDNFGTFTFSNVPGTTEDGITVVEGSNLKADNGGPSQAKVYVKFTENPAKAYATLSASCYTPYAVIYLTFGTDEGWQTAPAEPQPVVYTNKLYVVRGAQKNLYDDAQLTLLDKGDGKYQVTLPDFSDMDDYTEGTVSALTFDVDGSEADGVTTLSAENVDVAMGGDWTGYNATVSMTGTVTDGQLTATLNLNLGGIDGYDYTLYYGVEVPEAEVVSDKTYTSNLHIFDLDAEDETENLFEADEAQVNIVKYSDDTYKVTLKNVTLGEKTADLVFVGTADSGIDVGELSEDGGEGDGETEEPEGYSVIGSSDEATSEFFGGSVSAWFQWVDKSEDEIEMSFTLMSDDEDGFFYAGEFNYEKEPVTGINSVENKLEGRTELYNVNGVKLGKLQRGLNIVRSADGKVKKLLVK